MNDNQPKITEQNNPEHITEVAEPVSMVLES
jgi:hypothetical protein